MAPSSSTEILFQLTAFWVAPLLLLTITKAEEPAYTHCSVTDGNYTVNSTYKANLDVVLGSLSSDTNTTAAAGFSTNITGEAPDRVYGLALCRGDADSVKCGNCLQVAASDIQQICPFRKVAEVWYDKCYLRYSNRRFINAMENGFKVYLWNVNNITSGASEFNSSVWAALQSLAEYAVRNSSSRPPMFAAGEMSLGTKAEFPKLYGLVQCTRDISAEDCSSCLRNIIGQLPNCCSGKIGGRVLASSCNFRYEVGPFYNWSAALTLPPLSTTPLPPPPTPPPFPSQAGVPSSQGSVTVPGTNGTSNSNPSDGSGNKKNAKRIAITISLAVGFILLILMGCICFQKRKTVEKRMDAEKRKEISNSSNSIDAEKRQISTESLFFDLSTIRHATNNFSPANKLGEGGFGAVYKGTLASGLEIAVKRLSTSSRQGVKELKNEVLLLSNLQHRNLVRLLGLCLEDEEKILLYEYVANKSLDTFLFNPAKKSELNWQRRYNIIKGIARGLLYLHEESQYKIIHRDLKAGNILLDTDMNAKISDFGLARLFGVDESRACTSQVVGTFGYMSPEYAMRGHFSNKSDVFSFGVLVLEIVTGQRGSNFVQSEQANDLLSYVWDHWSSGSVADVLDSSLKDVCLTEALRCVEVALMCAQESPHDRPTMSKVVMMLDSYSISTQVLTRPVFLAGYRSEPTFGQVTGSNPPNDLPESPFL